MITGKRGYTIGQLFTVAVIFLVVVIVVSVVTQVLGKFQEQIEEDDLVATAYQHPTSLSDNETIVIAAAGTMYSLSYIDIIDGSELVSNATNGTFLVKDVQYGIDYAGGTVNSSEVGEINVSYQYSVYTPEEPRNITVKGMESMDEFGNWLPTIAIVIIAAVIIGIIFQYFRRN